MKENVKYYWKKFSMLLARTPWIGNFLGIISTLFCHYYY